jgi:sphinganine-1-phosphate aldolase
MYRDSSYRAYQYFVAPDWSGGIYASPTMPGSRPGGLIAATWVALMAMGESGYLQAAKEVMDVAKQIEKGVRAIPGLRVIGSPALSVIAFASTDTALNIYAVNEAMHARKWSLNTLQNPPAVHLCVTYVHRGCGERFVRDLEDSVRAVKEEPEKWSKGSAAIYGMAASIPDTSIVDDLARGYIDALYMV